MSKKKSIPGKQTDQKPVSSTVSKIKPKNIEPGKLLFDRIEIFLSRHLNKIFWILLGLTLLSGILLFDIRISTSGDDAAYIIRASDFIRHFIFPGFQGPFYPVVLSPLVAIFGIKVIPLKCLSLLFMLGFTGILYKAFKNRIPTLLLTAVLLLTSINSFVLYYASQTYSEALFMFLQAVTFYVFFTLFIDREEKKSMGLLIKQNIFLAFCVLCLGMTRSIGFVAVIAIAAYFLLKLQWKNFFYFIGSFVVVLAAFQVLKILIWGYSGMNFYSQVQSLLSKDYYNPALGRETFFGFIQRFAENSNLFISKYLYTFIGLRASDDSFDYYPFVTILTYLMLAGTLIISLRKNKYIFFTGIYSMFFLLITFFIAHTFWGQSRFIIPYFPLLLIVLLALFYYILSYKRMSILQVFLPVLILVFIILTLNTTIPGIKEARKITDRYYGLTPDWEHYCKISEWASDNLPKNELVACRKPSISFIYGKGKPFYGIMRIVSYPGDSILLSWQRNHLHYYVVSTATLGNGSVSPGLYNDLKNGLVAYGIENNEKSFNTRFFIMDFPDSTRGRTLNELNRIRISYSDHIDSLKARLNNPASRISIIYPDSLLHLLMKEKVTYVLTANLRTFPDQKTNRTNNTVERFMSFIEFKYPEIKTKIMQIGADDDEPASICKLNYGLYGFKFPF